MSNHFILKAIHVTSGAVLFGAGLGIAFFKWITDRTGNVAARAGRVKDIGQSDSASNAANKLT